MFTTRQSRLRDSETVHEFLTHLQSMVRFEQWELDLISENIYVRRLSKGTVLLSQGEISNFYFVIKGCLRTFYIKDSGSEFIKCIALEKSFCWATHSFLNQRPTNESIDALCNTEVIVMTKKNLDTLNKTSKNFNEAYQKGLEILCMNYASRVETFLTMDARLRYNHLLAKNPSIIQNLPNKMVASYLGITPESLSRLKR